MVQNSGALVHINYIASMHWLVFLMLLIHIMYHEPNNKWVIPYFGFTLISLFLLTGLCFLKTVYLRNIGFHHSELVPAYNPVMLNAAASWVMLVYLNFNFREKEIISLQFFKVIFGLLLVAMVAFIGVWMKAQHQYYAITHNFG